MYYIFASFVIGAVFAGGALMTNHPVTTQPTEEIQATTSYTQPEDPASPIVDNEALSADAVLSLGI